MAARRPKASIRPAASDSFAGFDRAALRFLTQLRRNNRREWFETHRTEFELLVRDPMRSLIEEMDVRFARLAPELVGDPRRSMFRIYRDVRFSKDKSPYKVHAAAWFYHQAAGRGVGGEAAHGGAGFYFHLEPGRSSVGGGIWMPPRPTLNLIREAIADRPKEFAKIVLEPSFKRRFGTLDDEAVLTRVPRGFAPDHTGAEWLRYSSFTAGRMLSDAEAVDPRLATRLETDIVKMLPLIRWLNRAIGFEPSTRRT